MQKPPARVQTCSHWSPDVPKEQQVKRKWSIALSFISVERREKNDALVVDILCQISHHQRNTVAFISEKSQWYYSFTFLAKNRQGVAIHQDLVVPSAGQRQWFLVWHSLEKMNCKSRQPWLAAVDFRCILCEWCYPKRPPMQSSFPFNDQPSAMLYFQIHSPSSTIGKVELLPNRFYSFYHGCSSHCHNKNGRGSHYSVVSSRVKMVLNCLSKGSA